MSDETYLITAAEIDSMEGLAKTHFMNPNAQRINKSLGDLTGLLNIGVHIIEVAPGRDSTEHHVHYHEEECIFILAGEATAYIGDDAHVVGPGDFIGYRTGGLPHSLSNTGTEMLRVLVMGQRADHDVGDYTRAGKRIYRNKDLPWSLVDLDEVKPVTAGAKK